MKNRLSRGGRTAVNLALCALVLLYFWGAADYPLPTAELEFRRLEETFLLVPSRDPRAFTAGGDHWVWSAEEEFRLWRAGSGRWQGDERIFTAALPPGGVLVPLEEFDAAPEAVFLLAAGTPEGTVSGEVTLELSAWYCVLEQPRTRIALELPGTDESARYFHLRRTLTASGQALEGGGFLFRVAAGGSGEDLEGEALRRALQSITWDYTYTAARPGRLNNPEFRAEAVFYDRQGQETGRLALSPLESPYT